MTTNHRYYQCGLCGIIEETGSWIANIDDYQTAEILLEEAVSIAKNCGKDKTCLIRRLRELAEIYASLEKYNEAEELYQQLMRVLVASLGIHHPNLDRYIQGYATLLRTMHRYEDAQHLEERQTEFWNPFLTPDRRCATPIHLACGEGPVGFPFPVMRDQEIIAWVRSHVEAEQIAMSIKELSNAHR